MINELIVALVDDDRIYQFTTERLLKRLDVNVRFLWFKDGEEAIAFMKEHADEAGILPDILIVDINMPYLDGWQFLDAFKDLRPTMAKSVDIYMVSSSNDDRDMERARTTEGVLDYVEKPITKEKLAVIIGLNN